MKRKKLLKRIVDSRPSKKTSKKVLKNNAKFLYNLCDLEPVNDAEHCENQINEIIQNSDGKMTKAAMVGEIKRLIDGACTDMDEKLVTTKPVDSVDIYLIRLQFNKQENPYDIITSPDVNLEAIKNIQACCVLHETKIDNDTTEK